MRRRPGILALLHDPGRRARVDQTSAAEHDGRVALAAGQGGNRSMGPAVEPMVSRMSPERARTPGSYVGVSILGFGRYEGWSLGQLAAHDRNYLEWLLRSSGGRQYHAEIESLLESR